MAKGRLLAYLNPVSRSAENGREGDIAEPDASLKRRTRRVIDREDIKQYKIPFAEISE
jgi:hypothetical protein